MNGGRPGDSGYEIETNDAMPAMKQQSPAKSVRSVGVLGLGIVGSRVAEACRRAGVTVVAWNRTPRRGVESAESPAAVAQAASVLQIFVTNDAALLGVIGAMAPHLTRRHVVINSSTVSLAATLDASRIVSATGAAFLDCPFTGSKNAAAAGELVYYVGGPATVLKRAAWALEPSAKLILPVGKVGDATILKLATNMVSAATVEILSEALGVVAAHGVKPARFLEAMEHNASGSGLSRMKLPSMIKGDFAPHFSLKNMLKDARFAEALARDGGVDVPALAVVRRRMAALAKKGRGEDDYSVLASNYLKA